jgi:acetyl esterase/lipase
MLGAQVGIRSLVAAWMAAPDFPWPTRAVDDVARWLPRPRHTQIGEIALPHCRAEWVRAERCGTKRAILYLHGGAFLTCGLNTHRPLVSCLSRSSDAPVLNVEYRMLPRYRSAMRSPTRWTAIDGCSRPAMVRATLWWPAIPPVATSHS